MTVPVGVLISGSGTNLQAILDDAARPDCPYRVGVVISNRRDAFGLERARAAGVPAKWVPHRRRSRPEFEAALCEELDAHGVEWVVLAGFMRLLTAGFLGAYPSRVINVHPALLPAFPGVDGQSQAIEYGVRIAGATVHLVDEGTDTGPVIAQGATAVLPTDSREQLKDRVLKLEHQLLPRAVRWAAEGRIERVGRTTKVRLPEGQATWMWLAPAPGGAP